MKKIFGILFILGFVFILVACGDGESIPSVDGIDVDVSTEPIEQVPIDDEPDIVEIQLEDLEEIIVNAGLFWEDFWHIRGRFAAEHIDFDEMIGIKNRILPESGFESLDDIRNYLLQYYTENWVDTTMATEEFVFAEYFDMLYMHSIRAGFPRPDWTTATHALIEQDGNRVIIETTVLSGAWQPELVDPTESIFRFTFIDGRIDDVDRDMILYIPQDSI